MSFRRGIHALAALAFSAVHALAQSPLGILNSSFPATAVGQFYSQSLLATGGVTPYTWSASGQVPPGLSVNPSGLLSGNPTAPGTYNFILLVVDSRQASASRSYSLTITSSGAGTRLTVTTTALPSGAVGQNYTQSLTATGGTPPYQWTVGDGLPAGLNLSSPDGTISGVPSTAGSFSFTAQVKDSTDGTATSTVTLVVNATPLTITTLPPIFNGTVGVAYVQTFRASGGTPPYSWSIVSGDAGNLTLDSASGNLQGAPQKTGTFTFTIQVRDQGAKTVSQPFTLTINPPAVGITTTGSLPAGSVGINYSQQIPVSATGGTPPYTWSLSGSAPAGLTFTPSNLTLSGVPNAAGTFSFTIQVADSVGLTASRSISLVINPAGLSITTSRQLPDGMLNQPYTQTMAAAGGLPPYRWNATGLPTGLTINSTTGQISGTLAAAGNFGIAVTVTDAALANLSDRFTLNVNLPEAPHVTFSGLPNSVGATQQFPIEVTTDAAFPAPITGQAILTFSPDSGPADRTIQFASGGTTANFTIPTGGTTPDVPLAIQTGTVSGTITISLRLQAGGVDITPNPAPTITAQVNREAPVIRGVQVNRSGNTINVVVTGYSTAREVTQAVFTFNASTGQSLQPSASSITVDVNTLFGNWFQDPNNSQFGSVFILTQPFTIQGDVNAVLPSKVTLTNRLGSVSFNIPQ